MASHHPRKTPEVVKLQEVWCLCVGRVKPSSSIQPSNKLSKRETSRHSNKAQIKGNLWTSTKSGEIKSTERDALMNEGVANLVNHGALKSSNDGIPFSKLSITAGCSSVVRDTLRWYQISMDGSPLCECLQSVHSPSPTTVKKSGTTLYDMITDEQEAERQVLDCSHPDIAIKKLFMQQKISSDCYDWAQQNDLSSCDLKLIFRNKQGDCIRVYAHSHILGSQSQYFATMIDSNLSKERLHLPHIIEIADCDNIELYLEVLQLMYSYDIKRKLLKRNIEHVLGVLKTCARISFEKGMMCCLEYLEAMPWAEEDEPKVTSLLSELQLEGKKVGEVLQRVSTDGKTEADNVLMNLIQMITVGTCEKARHEMKSLISRMLRENATQGCNADGLSKECLYEHCHSCVDKLVELFTMASTGAVIPNNTADDYRGILSSQIMRQADNLSWLLDIMIDRQVCDEFLRLWAFQTELASLHPQVPLVFGRYEISRIMAGLCVALGKGQVLAPREVRYELLHNWLQPLIDDFAWMRRACKGVDMATIEEGICQTISTLPLDQQQTMMIIWFEKFVQNGDDCPKLQRAFELCWRRIFFGSISSNTF